DELELSPKTLAQRLRELVQAGLLTRTAYNEIPPRVDYEVTQKAQRLRPIFDALAAWAAENDLKPMPKLVEVTT
ncbi:MAG TPA: helix-turn-helix domain-containing protein, partial [Thermoplasmata archaeon]|nr:helix-turn-helix domain-containing protein [Thermoplasmata archaeon]